MIKYCKNMILPTHQLPYLKHVKNIHPPGCWPRPSFVPWKNIYLMKRHPEQRLLPVFALQLPSSINLSPVLITRTARMHTRGNERKQTQPALALKFKRQTLVHLQHPLHRARLHTKRHENRKHPVNLTLMTLKQE